MFDLIIKLSIYIIFIEHYNRVCIFYLKNMQINKDVVITYLIYYLLFFVQIYC